MKILMQLFLVVCLFHSDLTAKPSEITPHKYMDEAEYGYEIPASARFTIKRSKDDNTEIIYYFSQPQKQTFPISILVGGSSLERDIISIIHFHRYFLKEFLDLGVGVITLEQQGVDGRKVSTSEFMEHYTRSNRLHDHRTVVEHLKKNPPQRWNGKLIFLGVSEGGPIVTTLTTEHPDITLATINWSGADDFSWDEKVWRLMKNLNFLISRKEFNAAMGETVKNPSASLKLYGMTYKYHHDALTIFPKPEYEKIKTPYLVVTGVKDSIIDGSDMFVDRARKTQAPVTYMRIPDMDHYVKKRQDVISDSFAWLKEQLSMSYVLKFKKD